MRKATPFVLAFVCLAGCDQRPPVDVTEITMSQTFARINIYAQSNGQAPPSLDVLPEPERYTARTTDGWGRQLDYQLRDDGIMTLTSYGADGEPGGEGEDADISRSYRYRSPEGNLLVGSATWLLQTPLERDAQESDNAPADADDPEPSQPSSAPGQESAAEGS